MQHKKQLKSNKVTNFHIFLLKCMIVSHTHTLKQNNLSLVTTPREYFGPVNIQTMNVQLLDEYGRIVDLNNMDFSFCVTLTTVYDL